MKSFTEREKGFEAEFKRNHGSSLDPRRARDAGGDLPVT